MGRVQRTAAAIALTALLGATMARAQQVLTYLGEQVTGTQELTIAAPGADRITYSLDGRAPKDAIVERDRAQIELFLGRTPVPHTLTITAYNDGKITGVTQHPINVGGSAAYWRVLDPQRYVPAGAQATLCARLPMGDQIASATLTRGEQSVPLITVRDRRCEGTALAATIPAGESPYLEARATTTHGRPLHADITLEQDPTSFADEITVREVTRLVRPLGRNGEPVPELHESDFRATEDRRVMPVRSVRPAADAPLRLAIVVDASSSTYGDATLEDAFVRSTLGLLDLETAIDPERDSAIVYAIGEGSIPTLAQWSSDRGEIETALRAALRLPIQERSEVYRTLEDVLYQFQAFDAPNEAAGAILYMTDGFDSSRNTAPEFAPEARRAAVEYARVSGVQVYAFDTRLPMKLNGSGRVVTNSPDDAYLDELVAATGGERISLVLPANPAPFMREAERLAMRHKQLVEENTERSLKDAQNVATLMKQYVREYERQSRLAQDSAPPVDQIVHAIGRIGELLREQYVLFMESTADGKPRLRQIEIAVEHPAVQTLRYAKGAFY